jgi:hypothetical protein
MGSAASGVAKCVQKRVKKRSARLSGDLLHRYRNGDERAGGGGEPMGDHGNAGAPSTYGRSAA